MRVCLDARKLHDSGIGTYIRGLLLGFQQIGGDVEFDFIAHPKDANSDRFSCGKSQLLFSRAKGYSLLELFTVSHLANRTQAQLFHAPHYVIPLGLKLPLVVTVHDLIHLKFPQYFSAPQRAYAHWMLRRVGEWAGIVLTVSERTKLDLIEMVGLAPSKIVVSYSGVAERFFHPMSDVAGQRFLRLHNLPRGYLLYVGNLKPHKNVSGLIAAWSRLADSVRPALVLVGEKADQYLQLQQLAQRLGKGKEAFFIGSLPDEEMVQLYRCSAAYVQPSWYEGFGSPPLEAMACCVPVAISNRGALPEIGGDAALLFDPSSQDETTATLERLLLDQTLREELIRKGPERARFFSWEMVADKTWRAYQEAISG